MDSPFLLLSSKRPVKTNHPTGGSVLAPDRPLAKAVSTQRDCFTRWLLGEFQTSLQSVDHKGLLRMIQVAVSSTTRTSVPLLSTPCFFGDGDHLFDVQGLIEDLVGPLPQCLMNQVLDRPSGYHHHYSF